MKPQGGVQYDNIMKNLDPGRRSRGRGCESLMEASRLCRVTPRVADQWPGMTISQSSRSRRVQGRATLTGLTST